MDIVQILYFIVLIGIYVYFYIKNRNKEIKHKKLSFILFIIQGISIIGSLLPDGIKIFSFPRSAISWAGYITHLISDYFIAEIGLTLFIYETKRTE